MLCRHVVLRQSVRRSHARLASTAVAAAEARRPPGRPRKTPIPLPTAAIEHARAEFTHTIADLPSRRGFGRPRKAPIPPENSNVIEEGKSDASQDIDGLRKSNAKGTDARKQPKVSVTKRARSPKRRLSLPGPPPKHYNLASFLEYAAKAGLKPGSNVYKGHHYEYTVIETLKRYDFTLEKMGRANDLGIDLLGTWNLPAEPRELHVLIQCKASRPRPNMVRELEGTYAGAPAGWKGEGVMALLVTREPATKGVTAALQRSRLPMGFAQITVLGEMKQFIWNTVASESRLTGVSVTNMYPGPVRSSISSSVDNGRLPGAITLLWSGKQWSSGDSSLQSIAGTPRESHPDATC